MKVEYILHENMTKKRLLDIIKVKSLAWPYSLKDQLLWIAVNIKNDDIHALLINDKNEISAYLNLIKIKPVINNIEQQAYGIGNVCALKRGSGDGGKLITEVNNYLLINKKIGLLFCNSKLVSFYERLGWKIIPKDVVLIDDISLETNTLIYNFNDFIDKLIYSDKLF